MLVENLLNILSYKPPSARPLTNQANQYNCTGCHYMTDYTGRWANKHVNDNSHTSRPLRTRSKGSFPEFLKEKCRAYSKLYYCNKRAF